MTRALTTLALSAGLSLLAVAPAGSTIDTASATTPVAVYSTTATGGSLGK